MLKPSFFMENFLPATAYMFPRGIDAGLITTLRLDTHLSLVAVADIGTAAAAAVAGADRFHTIELELASDYMTMGEVAKNLSEAVGTELAAPDMSEQEALAAGVPPMGASMEWLNVVGQPARPHYAQELDLPVTHFAAWAQRQIWA